MAGLINWLSQVIAVTGFGIRTLPQRSGAAAAAAFGIAGVVTVMVSVLSIANGVNETMDNSVSSRNAIVLRSGSDTEMTSGFDKDTANIIAEAPGIARNERGPIASPELFVVMDMTKRSNNSEANVPLRGIGPAAYDVRENFQLLDGRKFEWGRNEAIVGIAAKREFVGLGMGQTITVGNEPWTVVGTFSTGGGVAEGEIWGDAAVLQPAYRRGNFFQSVIVRLSSIDAFTEFKDSLTTDPRVNVKVLRESEYYAGQTEILTAVITGLGTLIAVIMGLGAMFGALNTMYATVSARTREIATLRALGFKTSPVIISILLESLFLALAGGIAGGALAYFAFDGFEAATLNWSSFSQVSFSFRVSVSLLMQGVLFAALIGLLGGLFPAIRAARLPVATALREL